MSGSKERLTIYLYVSFGSGNQYNLRVRVLPFESVEQLERV